MLASTVCRTGARVHRSARSDWQELRDQFLLTSSAATRTTGGWLAVWRLLIEHPWYREELAAAARTAVRRVGGPLLWCEDVEQDALLLLAKKLRRDPRLGLDPLRAERLFAAWLSRIIRNDCRQSVRRLRRLSSGSRLPTELPDKTCGIERETQFDVSAAIQQLAEPTRTVLLLYQQGFPLRKIEEHLGISYWQTWRIWRDGCSRLRVILA